MPILLFFKSMFLSSEKTCFLTRTSPNTFLRVFCLKGNVNKISNLRPKPLEKCEFCGILKAMFSWSRKACFFYIKRRKSVFHDSILRFITWAYMGLKGVTGGYKELQGVWRGDRALHAVRGGYKGLQKTCFLTSTSPDTLSWSILHKNQTWRN